MGKKPRWRDLSSQQKLMIMFFGAIQAGLLAAALWDIARRPAEQINGKKWIWASVSFINYVGPITYFVFGRNRKKTIKSISPGE